MEKQKLNEEISRIKEMMGVINEQPFNDEGEPMMTHQQYMNYSEPSEPSYDDIEDRPNDINSVDWLRNELKKNDIFLENFGSKREYFLSGDGNYDFIIYFENPGDMESSVSVHIYNDDTKKNIHEKFNDVIDTFNYILSVKDMYNFESYESAIKSYEKSQRDDMRDRYNNRMERGSFN